MQFPECKFAKSTTVYKQFLHLRSEVFEVQNAIGDLRMVSDEGVKNFLADRAVMECLDVIHSAETLIRVISREYPALDIDQIKHDVICKNAERGYYD